MARPIPVVEYLIEEAANAHDLRDLGGRKRAVDAIKPTLRLLRDPVIRDGYAAAAARRIGVDESTIREAMRKPGGESAASAADGRISADRVRAADLEGDLASILAGITDIYGSPYTTAKPFVDEGKLVGLGVSSAQRIPYLPNMPTVAETLPGYEVTTWHGLMLPANTPLAIRDRLQAAMTQAVNSPEVKRRFEELGYVGIVETPQQFAKFVHEDIDAMATLIKQYNLKPE